MRTVILLFLLSHFIAPIAARAGDLIARQGDDWVRAYEAPCNHVGTLIAIDKLAAPREGFQKAMASFGGQSFYGCWRIVGNVMHVVYEDGDQGIIPVRELKPVTEI